MLKRFWGILLTTLLLSSTGIAHAAISDAPLFLVTGAEPNVLLNMSVETPMGGAAYNDEPSGTCSGRIDDGGWVGICYSSSQTYSGYFDPNKCYSYNTTDGYFYPNGATDSDHVCSAKFSGNFMNWATMTAMDMFTWTMTGGNRYIDTTSLTVVQRNRKYNNDSWFPAKLISNSHNVKPSDVTEFTDPKVYIYNNDTGTGSTFVPQVHFGTTRGGSELGTYNVRVKVCDPTQGIESNCTSYNSGAYYKPEGLVQQNADSMRFAVMSYTLDDSADRNGGVLRANMKYVGPTKPDGSGGTVTNSVREYGTDGIYIDDPDSLINAASGVYYSGVINYINKFSTFGYKSHDPASELYYESLRYFKHLGPTPEYYQGLDTDEKGGFPVITSWNDPYQYSCQKGFIIGINDANPWLDKTLPGTRFTASTYAGQTLTASDYGEPSDAAGSGIDVSTWTDKVGDDQGISGTSQCIGCTESDCDWIASDKLITALSKVAGTCPAPAKQNSYYISGLAYYANTTDLRSDLAGDQTVSTFMIDTQEYNANPLTGQMNMLWLAGKFGGFIDQNGNGKPDLDSEWDADGDGEPDNYVLATESDKLVSGLSNAFLDVENREASVAAIAANSTRLNTLDASQETVIYQSKFNSADWSGWILAYKLNTDGSVGANKWSTLDSGKIPTASSRNIYTWNGSTGLAFTATNWSSLSATQQADLQDGGTVTQGQDRLNWIRGDQSNETTEGGTLRSRNSLMGDIINSTPAYVADLDFGYENLPTTTEALTYNNYVAANKTRTPMLYVGANDGMLHAFDADTGVEQFAFIPNGVYDNLVRLTSPTYSHKYFVDASPFIGDAYIDDDQDMNNIIASANRRWRTVLVGATGAGGRSVFALDVSDPDNFTQADILWEFTDPDLGYTIGQPVAARMANGDWAAIFGNGYNSDNGKAFLFIVNLETGALIKKIDTGIGSTTTPNGLGTPALLADGQGVISTAYAGDLYGNIWKFDLSASNEGSNNTSGWTSAFKSGSTLLPFFTAKDSSAVAQPITAPLNIGTNPNGGYMIYFGTGKYFEDNDKYVGSNPQVQSFYALWDDGTRISTTDRSELTHQVIFSETADWRSVEQATGSQPASPRGWYLDLESPVNGAEGERIVSEPLLRNGRAIFTTLTPDSDPCSWGGTSWVMELTSTTGTVAGAVFDTNGDGLINAADSSVSGQKVGAIISTPKVISYGNGETEGKYAGDSSGGITVIKEQGSSGNPLVGRRSWRIVH